MKKIEVYEAGSTLVINGSGQTGIVEKAIIGTGGTVSYQIICYVPERHPQQVQDFEVSAVEGKTSKRQVGFAQSDPIPIPKEINVTVDKDDNIVDIDVPDGFVINTRMEISDPTQEGDYENEAKEEQEKEKD